MEEEAICRRESTLSGRTNHSPTTHMPGRTTEMASAGRVALGIRLSGRGRTYRERHVGSEERGDKMSAKPWRSGRVVVLGVLAVLAATDAGRADGEPPLGPEYWTYQNPLPGEPETYSQLHAVWCDGPNGAFAVGEAGTILMSTGSAWESMDSGTTESLADVWGSGPNDVFAVGSSGTILHYDGSGWLPMSSGTSLGIHGVWGTASDNVYAVCDSGRVLHYNGAGWSTATVQTMLSHRAVWGSGPDDIWVVADFGIITHYDGSSWSTVDSGTEANLRGLHGTGPGHVVAVGEGGTILEYDGSSWSSVASGTGADLRDVWCAGPADVHAVGDWVILHHDGTGWTRSKEGGFSLYGVWGCAGDLLAVGYDGQIWSLEGGAWSKDRGGIGFDTITATLRDLWGSGPNDVFTVGNGGTIAHFDGNRWSRMASGTMEDLQAVFGSGPNDVYAVGNNSTCLRYDGSSWSSVIGPTGQLKDVWASGPNDVYVAKGTETVWHYDGNTWTTTTAYSNADVWALWGFGPNDVYAIAKYQYSSSPHAKILYAQFQHYDGATWTVVAEMLWNYLTDPGFPRAQVDLFDLWGASPNCLVAGAKFKYTGDWEDCIFIYDGSTMTRPYYGGWYGIRRVWGTNANNLYLTNTSMRPVHFDGTSFETVVNAAYPLLGVWGIGDEIFFVGDSGAIMHTPPQYLMQLSVYDPNLGQVTIHPDVTYYEANAPVVLTPQSEPGWIFQEWIGDVPPGHETDDPLTIIMDDDKEIMAVFGPAYTLTMSYENPEWGMVTVTPESDYYTEGTQVTLEATPDAPYGNFVAWQGDVPGGSSTQNPLTITMDGDKEITAVFAPDPVLNITILEPGWGTVSATPNMPYYPEMSTVQLEANPAGYRNFLRWEGDVPGGSSTQNPIDITMDGDKNISAVFEWPVYNLSLSEVNGMWGITTVDPYLMGYNYQAGQEVTLTAIPEGGREFSHWVVYDPNHPGDANFAIHDANSPILTIVMMADREVEAVYACGSGIDMALPLLVLGLTGCWFVAGRLRRSR